MRKTWELLDSPEKWTKGAYARNKCGAIVSAVGLDACCWDISGALFLCYESLATRSPVTSAIKKMIDTSNFVTWNDDPERTFEEVRAVLLELDI